VLMPGGTSPGSAARWDTMTASSTQGHYDLDIRRHAAENAWAGRNNPQLV
jgi:hypothetical protein